MVGSSLPLRDAIERAIRLAPWPAPVLIHGPTGSGKENMARLVHEASARPGPFTPVNCAALPEHLIESELFGHERGAFTGARDRREGLIEATNGGTLFLDEIGELPLALQPKLLRFLESGTIRRVGGTRERPVDVRVVAATHKDLAALSAAGTFRADLYFRLRQSFLTLPPLAERGSDIPTLARHFLAEIAKTTNAAAPRLSREAAQALKAHPWPGNVRELKALMYELAVCHGLRRIKARHVEASLGTAPIENMKGDGDHRLLTLIQETSPTTARDLRRATGLTKGDLQRRLLKLIEGGWIRREGKGRATRYVAVVRASKLVVGGGGREGDGAMSADAALEEKEGEGDGASANAEPCGQRDEGDGTSTNAEPCGQRDEEDGAPFAGCTLSESERLALSVVVGRGQVQRGEIAEALGCSDRTATRVLRRLAAKGLIVKTGAGGRGVGYGVGDAF